MKKPWLSMIMSGLAIACFTAGVFAQVPAKEPAPVEKVTQVNVKGKIIYSTTMKRYVIRGRGEVYGIANQNPGVLDQVAKGKQTVTVGGRTAGGDQLFIETIDGAPYQGAEGAGSK